MSDEARRLLGDQEGGDTVPPPISAPPAPQRLLAPHNLFTMAEVLAALRLLAVGLDEHSGQRVRVTWDTGSSRLLVVEDLPRITEVDHVERILVSWRYTDDSHVLGFVVNRPEAGHLSVENGGRALSAAHACLDHLRGLRSQRAQVRQFWVGTWPLILLATLVGVAIVVLVQVSPAAASLQHAVPGWALLMLTGLVEPLLLLGVHRWARRRVGGTRLARTPQVQHRWLTPEVGVLASLLAVLVAVVGVLVTAVAS